MLMTLFLYMATVSTVTATLIHYTETMKRIRDMHEYRSHMVMKMLVRNGLILRIAMAISEVFIVGLHLMFSPAIRLLLFLNL